MIPDSLSILTGKTILVISPQSWGKMFVSKHHYAIELTRKGNKVYFLEPPSKAIFKGIHINKVDEYPGLYLINHSLYFPYDLKFHSIRIFHLLMKFHIKKVLKRIGQPVDIVWSFDLGNLYPFRFFSTKALKIFHPVDEPLNKAAIDSAKGAHVIFSVTREILEKYKRFNLPSFFINHGVSELFFLENSIEYQVSFPVKVGFSGNLFRKDIDRSIFLRIIKENPLVIFECWGSYQKCEANIGGEEDLETITFINELKLSPNVNLHGTINPDTLAQAYKSIDIFLICYDIYKDQSHGTNYHKIMEFLASGKVVISNNVTTYHDKPDMLIMPEDRNSNEKLPGLFREVISSLDYYNSPNNIALRKEFAKENLYSAQISRIQEYISQFVIFHGD